MRTTLTLLLLLITISIYAQKLPQTQQISLRAPAAIKVDGKATEWGTQHQAYNKTTGIFYSMANDDENLYLVIYTNNIDFTNKILNNGVNISFNAKKKSTDNSVVIHYPITPTLEQKREKNKLMMSKLSKDGETIKPEDRTSGQLSLNKAMIALNKQIKVNGVSALTDSLFSIYDAKGIMVGMDSPDRNSLCYELAVPLKYLGISPSELSKLNYNIRLNEDPLNRFMPDISKDADMVTQGGNNAGSILFATDFWGEYTLAK